MMISNMKDIRNFKKAHMMVESLFSEEIELSKSR